MEETLKKIGLSPVEIKAYLVLLNDGPSLAGNIAKKAQVNRSNAYDALQRLIEKGLVGFVVKENRKYFQITEPENIYSILEDKKNKLEKEINDEKFEIDKIIPIIKSKRKKDNDFLALIYEGRNGIKSFFNEMLNSKEEIMVFGISKNIREILSYYLDIFHKERIKQKQNIRIILSEELRLTRGLEFDKMKFTKVRYLQDEFILFSTINICKDKTATFIWSQNPVAFVINNKEVAKLHKKEFEQLWKIAKE